jgi:S-formylglutathione hydrolase FrmB
MNANSLARWLIVLVAGALVPATAAADPNFPECAEPETPTVMVGTVACQLIDSALVGGKIPFSYYVPRTCDPSLGIRCPVLYLLHGFGGDYRSLLVNTSAYVDALTSGPPEDPEASLTPWMYYDRSLWVPKDPLHLILVASQGRTVPGGFGPEAGLDSFWTDWNPRYAQGGDLEKYATPPPRFEHYLLDELIPFVEANFPAGSGREWRALDGESLGGYGSYKNGLQHPDVWASIGSISGAHNFLFTPWLDPTPVTSPVGLSSPADLGYFPLTGPGSAVPFDQLPDAAKGFLVALIALGDPAADQAYFRGNMPRDLAMNGRAWRAGEQVLHIRGMVNDTIPRRPEDFSSNPAGYPTAQAFEDIVLPMNLEMEAAFIGQGVEQDFHIHPGLHSRPYRDPYLRHQLEEHYARLEHGGNPIGRPDVFDYRSIAKRFSIWGWRFQIDRKPVEFLNLRNVSCSGLTLQGTGSVTVKIPGQCQTGFEGERTFTVDLGPSYPIDEPAGASAAPIYGKTVTRNLTPLHP